jgi:hypothetical protein
MRMMLLLALVMGAGVAAAADVMGSRDLEVLTRFPGAEIVDFRERSGERAYPLGALRRLSGKLHYEREVTSAGQLTAVTYALPALHGALEVFGQSHGQLREQGAHMLYWCEGRECGSSNLWANNVFGNARLYGSDDQQAYAVLRLAEPNANSLLVLYAITRGNRKAYLHVEQLDASEALGEVLPSAATLLRQLRSNGTLDLGQLQGEPDAQWSQVLARALSQDSTLRVMISGAQAQQWRERLVAEGIRAGRLELDDQQTTGLRLDRLR